MHYWKEGPARLLSHLNVMQLMERAMIRSEFPLRFTEGFNPHPKFATSPAIPLGMSSHSELRNSYTRPVQAPIAALPPP